MASDEPESRSKHRTGSEDGDDEDSKRRKHGRHRHHHSSSSSRHKRHHRHRSGKHEHDTKEREENVDPTLAIVAASSYSRLDDDKEEGEILEEDDYNGGDDGKLIKKKVDSDVESGEIKPEEAMGVRSDHLDRDGKETEEFELNLNLSPEHNGRDIVRSAKMSRKDRNNDDDDVMLVNSSPSDQPGNLKMIHDKVHVPRNSRNEHLVSGGKTYEVEEVDGSSAEFESFKSRERKGKRRHDGSSSRDSTPNHVNGVIGCKFQREDKKLHKISGSPVKGSREEKNYVDAEPKHNRSRTPVSSENVSSRKHRKTNDCEYKAISSRDVETCDLVRYEFKGHLESMDVDGHGSENQEKLIPSEAVRDKDKNLSHSSSHYRYHDEIHNARRSRSYDPHRERSRSRSVLQEEALMKRARGHEKDTNYYEKGDSLHGVKNDSDHERLVRRHGEERHGSRDWVSDREREHSASYGRYIESVDRHGHREVRDADRDRDWGRRERERERYRAKDTEMDRHRDRDKERDRDRDRIRERDNKRERDGERQRDRDRDKESDKVRNHHKHDGLADGYGGRGGYKDSRRLKHDKTEYNRHRNRSKEPDKTPFSTNEAVEQGKNKLKRDDDEQDNYQERIVLQLAEQEEEDLDRIKEESRKRRQAILEKYKQQQLQQQEESHPEDLENEKKSSEQPCPSEAVGNAIPDTVEGRNDGTDVYVADPSFSVGKSPPQNGTSGFEKTSGACGLGDGTPKGERSDDMFCDDIFGESPAGVRKPGKGDGLPIERSGLHDNWDDAEGYYSYRFGEILDGRYEVTAAHGKGVFSTVVRAKDLKAGKGDPEEVAIKIIRNNDTMYKAGMEELIILKKLAGADPDDRRHCVRFLSSFKYRNHLCLVFESLHMNLREVLKKFGRNIGLKLTAVRAYAKQLFIALKHLRNCGVLHCDIKPDNMLVNEAKNVLKLCDFGNAMFSGKNEITPYLVSRFYRAPEIILGLPYDHPLDIWSVGCCLYELYSGKVLFPGPTNNDMLRLHMELKGPFPKKILRKAAFADHHFDQDLNFHATEEDPVTKKTIKRLLLNIKPKDISTLITGSPGEDPKMLANFKDLLERIFVLDPEKRMTVSQALSHPFITGK